MKKFLPVAIALGLCSTSSSPAQPPNNGYIGIHCDAQGTGTCIVVPPFTSATAWVIATLAGGSAGGISSAEFRIELEDITPAGPVGFGGYLMTWTPTLFANLVLGNPLDETPGDDTDPRGINIAWPTCQTSDPVAGAGRVFLGTISFFNLGAGQTTDLVVRRRIPPTSINHNCAKFTLCGGPLFTVVCLTVQHDDPVLGGQEAANFIARLGPTDSGACSAFPYSPCMLIGVEPRTWSSVRGLYR